MVAWYVSNFDFNESFDDKWEKVIKKKETKM